MSNVSIINKERKYFNRNRLINKNKEEFKTELLGYARANFKDQITDFSEASLGGMLLDFAAIVGESLTYYVDQQINELDYETAITENGLLQHIKKANLTAGFASPSSVIVDFLILAPVDVTNSEQTLPDTDYLPIIKKGTEMSTNSGINFILSEDVDFQKDYKTKETITSSGSSYLLLEKSAIATSGNITFESFSFNLDEEENFLSYTLENENITKIIKVEDNDSFINEYYEVEFLSQDTVYEKVKNNRETYFNVRPAPFRYILERDYEDGLTTVRFGNGNNQINEDGLLTNPEELSLPIKSRDYFNNISLDPKNLISSPSLGVSPVGKTITVKYIHGGGQDHNILARDISEIKNLNYSFPNLEDIDTKAIIVINSMSITNKDKAVGGTDPLSLEELRGVIPSAMKMQSRIVNHEDLISRLYSMPSDFGRISKVSILDNMHTKNAKDLCITCKDLSSNYVNASNALKFNISNFINEFRVIGDTFNIVDAKVFNISVFLKIKVSSNYDPETVVTDVKDKIFTLMMFEKLQIGESINVNKIVKIALDTPGVLTISSNFKNIVRTKTNENNTFSNRMYNDNSFSSIDNYEEGILYSPRGGIFQLKYQEDIEVITG
jgi:hypothetical protein